MTKTTDIHLRSATPEDLPAVTDLFRKTVLHVKEYTKEQVNTWALSNKDNARWQDRIRRQHFLLAESKGKLVGFGSITADGYLDTLFVDKKFQRKGVATTIMQELLGYARKHRVEIVHSEVSLTAKPFFEKYGFRVIKPQQVVLEGVVFVNYVMTIKV
ncbi:GNAT family N-acetyltransferase [Catalinimonas niigatensis]|uniref:GNAT family N-acetyltransferase n=1 Tax=Catalinimonas niigatensis TaxID=1397264 RepID=UPI0026652D56|nr:GNAT family N-acetyltransferase [Catalinimonas niigatensis]WPP51609.1 GNAT family N-acetyltransferase [Catalinimonas niigatensis]